MSSTRSVSMPCESRVRRSVRCEPDTALRRSAAPLAGTSAMRTRFSGTTWFRSTSDSKSCCRRVVRINLDAARQEGGRMPG